MTILQKKGLPDFRQAVLFFAEYVCKIVLQHVFFISYISFRCVSRYHRSVDMKD